MNEVNSIPWMELQIALMNMRPQGAAPVSREEARRRPIMRIASALRWARISAGRRAMSRDQIALATGIGDQYLRQVLGAACKGGHLYRVWRGSDSGIAMYSDIPVDAKDVEEILRANRVADRPVSGILRRRFVDPAMSGNLERIEGSEAAHTP